MPFIICILFLYLGVNVWIFAALLTQLSTLPLIAKIGIAIVYWLLAGAFFMLQLLRHQTIPPALGHVMYLLGTTWLVVMLYMTIFYGLTSLLQLVGVAIPYRFWGSVGLTAVLLLYGNIKFHQPKVTNLELKMENAKTISSPLRIVAMSDVHLGYGITKSKLKEYIQLINSEQPDVVVIAGDLIDMTVLPLWNEKMQETLRELHAPLGVYWVAGNHEYISGIPKVEEFMAQTPFVWLRDSVAVLPNGLQLVGRDDRSNRNRKSVAQLFDELNPAQPIFFIDHQPINSEVQEMITAGSDFAFFGHTHHGQFLPINWLTDLLFQYSYGYHYVNHTHLYTSSGLGLWGPPFRIGSNSEIVVLNIR